MLKIAAVVVMVVGAGTVGYFGESFIRPKPAPSPENTAFAAEKQLLFKLPLGKFTMQIMQRDRTLHIAFDMDVYVMGAHAFQKINGAVGRARLRDAIVTALAELAETDPDIGQPIDDDIRMEQLAAKLVRKLFVDFPEIRTGRINNFNANATLREKS